MISDAIRTDPSKSFELKHAVPRPHRIHRSRWWIGLVLLSCLLGGCRSRQVVDQYGDSLARNSPSGLSILRSFAKESGNRTYRLISLSSRAKTLDVIVWAPDGFDLPSPESIDWFKTWLEGGKNRTLIFIGRDDSPTANYWEHVAESVAEKDSIPYRIEQALAQSTHDMRRGSETSRLWCPWFVLKSESKSTPVTALQGPWSTGLDPSKGLMKLRDHFIPRSDLDPSKQEKMEGYEDYHSKEESDSAPDDLGNGLIETEGDIALPKEADPLDMATEDEPIVDPYEVPQSEVLLSTDTGVPLVFAVRMPSWNQGKVLAVANGSYLLNFGAANTNGRILTRHLFDSLPPQSKIGFLQSNSAPMISDYDTNHQGLKGLDLLTLWPMSFITMHAVILGLFVLFASLPIFGRPKQLQTGSERDFGQHVEAMGGLLEMSGDRDFALKVIGDYFRNVRREANHPWANPIRMREPEVLPAVSKPNPTPSSKDNVSSSTTNTNNNTSNQGEPS